MNQEIEQFDPFAFASWQVASMPEPTPWPELTGLSPKQAAITLIREREIPGLKTNPFHQTLILDTLEQASPEEVVCVERDGVATLQARVPETDLSLRARIDLSTEPERRPIFYSLHEKDQPSLDLSLLGPSLIVETPELKENRVGKSIRLGLFLKSPPPHSLSFATCRMLPPPSLSQEPLVSVGDLNERETDTVVLDNKLHTVEHGFSEEQLVALTQIPTTRPSEFLDQLADTVFNAYSNAEIVPII